MAPMTDLNKPVQPQDMITDGKENKQKSEVDYVQLENDIKKLTESNDKTKLPQTLEGLLSLEKTYRLQADLKATTMCCIAVVQVRKSRRYASYTRWMCLSIFPSRKTIDAILDLNF